MRNCVRYILLSCMSTFVLTACAHNSDGWSAVKVMKPCIVDYQPLIDSTCTANVEVAKQFDNVIIVGVRVCATDRDVCDRAAMWITFMGKLEANHLVTGRRGDSVVPLQYEREVQSATRSRIMYWTPPLPQLCDGVWQSITQMAIAPCGGTIRMLVFDKNAIEQRYEHVNRGAHIKWLTEAVDVPNKAN